MYTATTTIKNTAAQNQNQHQLLSTSFLSTAMWTVDTGWVQGQTGWSPQQPRWQQQQQYEPVHYPIAAHNLIPQLQPQNYLQTFTHPQYQYPVQQQQQNFTNFRPQPILAFAEPTLVPVVPPWRPLPPSTQHTDLPLQTAILNTSIAEHQTTTRQINTIKPNTIPPPPPPDKTLPHNKTMQPVITKIVYIPTPPPKPIPNPPPGSTKARVQTGKANPQQLPTNPTTTP